MMLNLTQAEVNHLKATLQGDLLSASDPGYDTARTVWNAMIDRRPWRIARCTNANDVVAAVNFARTHDLLRVKTAYGANHARLAALKAQYDPTNFFRLNHNIEPNA